MRRAPLRAALAVLALAAACRSVAPPPVPEAARTAEGALEELAPEAFPAFADDLDYAGLDDAIGRSAGWLARLAAADPGRTIAFGKERVPIQKLQATLARFRELALARLSPEALGQALRREFRVFRSIGDGRGTVLFTGYYLPELRGSPVRQGKYQVPLHRAPDDLVVVRAKDFPALTDDLIGRVEGGRLVPYPTRAEIAGGALEKKNAELCFVDSAVDAFFVEIQGSGIVRFEDGTSRVVTFAGKNGHRYGAVGAELVRRGAIGVPVTPDRTVAADARVFPKGALAFVETERPVDASGATMRPFSRFVLDQDAGGAIRTSARIDLYLGSGAYAENAAGRMRQPGRLYYLLAR